MITASRSGSTTAMVENPRTHRSGRGRTANPIRNWALAVLALSGLASGQVCLAGATISNGTVTLGVNDEGNLAFSGVGLTYVPTSGEAITPGCACEGWGAGDALSSRSGWAGESSGDANIILDSFINTSDSATSVVRINDGADLLRVTHNYAPSATPNLYRVDVTVENLSGGNVQLRYRRAMDWDVPPTEFNELVTLFTGGATNVIFSSDDGFASPDPFAGPSSILFTGEATDSGPEDHGALFDFDFGTLAAGGSFTFTIFYGAADNQADALAALGAVGAEVYSLGKPDPADPGVDTDGNPNTFIFGFAGVGGTPVGNGPTAIPTLSPWALAVLAGLIGILAVAGLRRRAG